MSKINILNRLINIQFKLMNNIIIEDPKYLLNDNFGRTSGKYGVSIILTYTNVI